MNKIFLLIMLSLFGVIVPIFSQADNTEDNFDMGVEAFEGSDYRTAINYFESVLHNIETDSDNYAMALFMLGTCYTIIEQPQKACALYDEQKEVLTGYKQQCK